MRSSATELPGRAGSATWDAVVLATRELDAADRAVDRSARLVGQRSEGSARAAEAMAAAGDVLCRRGYLAQAGALCRAALVAELKLGAPPLDVARCLSTLGDVARLSGDTHEAGRCYRRSFARWDRYGFLSNRWLSAAGRARCDVDRLELLGQRGPSVELADGAMLMRTGGRRCMVRQILGDPRHTGTQGLLLEKPGRRPRRPQGEPLPVPALPRRTSTRGSRSR